ncbi:histone-lysine N-methyltransferase SETMAR [Elysia marginata]|uniref:Histone-lysine N-methyltransferase SETMAR n=1 Tax=Elysia marginata TaxID=1093978 RepID=A0AAV4H3D9_9GAST|nr:histone-lysine N-methyltransferase SETMAR [Elysia marginata]
MATPIKHWSKLEVGAVVRVLLSKGIRPSEIHKRIAETYGDCAMSRSRVYQWCTWFGEGRTRLNDEPKSSRPKTSTSKKNTTRVDKLINCDRRMKIGEIALKLEIPNSAWHFDISDDVCKMGSKNVNRISQASNGCNFTTPSTAMPTRQ